MTDLIALTAANGRRWTSMHLNGARLPAFHATALRLCAPAAKARYQAVTQAIADLAVGGRTDLDAVPWWAIAVAHERESSQNWNDSLAQGDPWNRASRHVPAARGPFKSWEEAAVDALVNCPPFAAHNSDWSIGGALTMLERYNGLAYANHGMPSPYIWSGTDQYVRGKVLVDHGPIEPVVDVQEGCAGLLSMMMAIDPSIELGSAA